LSLTFNLADLWEAVTDRVPDRLALVAPPRRLTYADLEDRANRLAAWLSANGIGPGDHVGLHLYNGSEHIEALLAAYKVRAVPVNVNHRYVEAELRHLFDDADLVAVVHEPEFADRIAAVRPDLPELRVSLERGAAFEAALAASSPERPDVERSSDDRYVIYTGGTTGLPKGVVWRHEDAFHSCIGGGDPMRLGNAITEPSAIVERIIDHPFVFFPLAPLMHGAAQWTSLSWLYGGATVVLDPSPRFDAATVLRMIGEHQANTIVVVGDAVARPLADEYRANADRYDVSSLFAIGSGGVALTPAMRAELHELFPDVVISDGYGSSETGAQAGNRGEGRFVPYDDATAVIDDEALELVAPGSGRLGRVARRGHIPLGYHKDPEKTAATFVEVAGDRWVLTGDVATVRDDGSIELLGRGSQCINTGGEKVFPEEVEAALTSHPDVYDALVVGVPDPRWGERVAAVVAPRPDRTVTLELLAEHCRSLVASYKVPKALVLVDRVERSPAGKADYRWARDIAAREGPQGDR
jgi:acyl-CoA synthetase (AMP-forming)/AMP-acid ligase II